jgi:nitrite reductase/ring-hydroxylating ferredoxin subunit
MSWVKALDAAELPQGERKVVEVEGKKILLVHHSDGELYAMQNDCTHMGAPLVKGEVREDGTLVCPRHHTVFDMATGEVQEWVTWPPGVGTVLGAVSKEKDITVYPTKVAEGTIWIDVDV